MSKQDPFAASVRKVLGRYVSVRKVKALRRDEGQVPYEAGPPISPLHS
jgi:hypothetical protein